MSKVVRGAGWLLVVSGAVVLLYVVYLLWFTNFETERAQNDLAETWAETESDGTAVETGDTVEGTDDGSDHDDDIEVEDAYAAMWFERDGERIIQDEEIYVVEGVSLDRLRSGPGHYPDSDRPGGAGNFAIAGHRTTYGAPFWSLDELQEGDTIHVIDRERREWVYAYRTQEVVAPTALWVVGRDPLESGEATITLTTCHPRGSAAERLIVWGALLDEPIESTAADVPAEEIAEG
ncbi:MAG: class E sortase [Nitriliruptoraceae bacterium]